MRRARILVHGRPAGYLMEVERGALYRFAYEPDYDGQPVSLTMPVSKERFEFSGFPPFFDGMLPEGVQLEALLRLRKLDRDDLFGQLLAVGEDLIGAVTAEDAP
jgi:serine/threonine-protein kinase HipA